MFSQISDLPFSEALIEPVLKGTLLLPYIIPLVKGNASVAEDAKSFGMCIYIHSRYHDIKAHKLEILSLGTPSSGSTEMPSSRLCLQEPLPSLVVCKSWHYEGVRM